MRASPRFVRSENRRGSGWNGPWRWLVRPGPGAGRKPPWWYDQEPARLPAPPLPRTSAWSFRSRALDAAAHPVFRSPVRRHPGKAKNPRSNESASLPFAWNGELDRVFPARGRRVSTDPLPFREAAGDPPANCLDITRPALAQWPRKNSRVIIHRESAQNLDRPPGAGGSCTSREPALLLRLRCCVRGHRRRGHRPGRGRRHRGGAHGSRPAGHVRN